MYWIDDAATAAIVLLVLAFWKPWAQAYAGEKGKNLARTEDLDRILAEIRAVTATQKDIESRISMDMWRSQRLWDERRSAYARLLVWLDKLRAGLLRLPAAAAERGPGLLMHSINGVLEPIAGELRQARANAAMFLASGDLELLSAFVANMIQKGKEGKVEDVLKEIDDAEAGLILAAQHCFSATEQSQTEASRDAGPCPGRVEG